ncbi:MAG: rhomboid family intramembrane serine protease [Ignavibacteriaceae bacterium]
MNSYNYYRPTGFGGFSFFPPVIKNLLIINGVVFFIQLLGQQISTQGGLTFSQIITKYFALIPIEGVTIGTRGGQIVGEWSFYPWQLITYQFMHGGFSHILFNMFALWMFGMEIENLWGSKKFLSFYLIAGVVAGLFQLFITPLLGGVSAPTIGASGAVYGVLIAFALLFPDRYIFLYFLIPVKAKYLIGFLLIMEFMLVDSANSGVAHLAHLGGALAGFVFIMLDKSIHIPLKDMFSSSYYRTGWNVRSSFKNKTKEVEDADFYEIDNDDETVDQEEIDRILDKISRSGYQNLTEREKKILFEASKRMNK